MLAQTLKRFNRQIFWTEDTLLVDTDQQCISIPKEPWFKAQVFGCLSLMSEVLNWEERGDVTAVEASSLAAEMILSINEGCGQVIGELKYGAFKAGFVPENWLPMDGQSTYLKEDYPELFASSAHVINLNATQFGLWDMRGRVLVGSLTGSAYFDSVNSRPGQNTVGLSAGNNGTHTHNIPNVIQLPVQAGAGAVALAYAPPGAPFPTQSSGSGSAHLNIQPSHVTNVYIVAK